MQIRTKKSLLLLYVSIIVLVSLIIIYIVNGSFFEKYYTQKKYSAMATTYNEISDALKADNISVEIKRLGEVYDVEILLLNIELGTVFSSTKDDASLSYALMGYLFDDIQLDNIRLIDQTDRYSVVRGISPENGIEYIDTWGFLDDGFLVLIRSSASGIRESVNISRKFFDLIVYAVGFLLGIFVFITYRSSIIRELTYRNEQLRNDILQKERIDNMRREFLSNVSHELKTPISLIQGYAEGLKENINSDDNSKDYYCEVILDESNKMNSLVNKLLDLNSLEFGNINLDKADFDIVGAIKDYITTSEVLSTNLGIAVIIEQQDSINVFSDEYYIMEVFDNYFSNALNHISGDNIIKIDFELQDEFVRVKVFNSGKNIPEESIDRIWDKFYKVDKARTREYGGSGVGLSIVKAIMDITGGECGARNLNNGVEFFFTVGLKL